MPNYKDKSKKFIVKCKQEFVRPRWPYDMRPSAEKYMCVIVIR